MILIPEVCTYGKWSLVCVVRCDCASFHLFSLSGRLISWWERHVRYRGIFPLRHTRFMEKLECLRLVEPVSQRRSLEPSSLSPIWSPFWMCTGHTSRCVPTLVLVAPWEVGPVDNRYWMCTAKECAYSFVRWICSSDIFTRRLYGPTRFFFLYWYMNIGEPWGKFPYKSLHLKRKSNGNSWMKGASFKSGRVGENGTGNLYSQAAFSLCLVVFHRAFVCAEWHVSH